MIQRERDYTQIYESINPLDRRDGRVPSWIEIVDEFDLGDLPRGVKKLYHAYYRAQRMFALGKRKKGGRLIDALDKLPHFVRFEEEHDGTLNLIARRVRGKGA